MQELTQLMKALSDQNRLRIMAALSAHGELCACEIVEMLGIKGASVSRHLSILVTASLIQARKLERWMIYSLSQPEPRLQPMLGSLLTLIKDTRQARTDHDLLRVVTGKNKLAVCRRIQSDKLKILFLCTGNSCRSQMAEGFARALKGNLVEAVSAGIETHGLNPHAVRVMQEVGVDISHHHSTHVDEFRDRIFDYVITVCDQAHETCPYFPSGQIIHVGFDDPPKMAREIREAGGSPEDELNCYRRVRDQIREFILNIPQSLVKEQCK